MHYNVRAENPNFQHGQSYTQVYRVWAAMKDRCTNSRNVRWHRYGGRGVKVCKRWLAFANFLEDMGPRPDGTTLERKKNNIGYRPSNCIWATSYDQSRNRSTTRWLTHGGETLCVSDWAKRFGMTRNTFNYRLNKGTLRWPALTALCP